uniref:Uncharacterized protein n=1 Tax=Rhizophora mucronata TaxID=61149 RepID=A0A2P2NM65_RHIMU
MENWNLNISYYQEITTSSNSFWIPCCPVSLHQGFSVQTTSILKPRSSIKVHITKLTLQHKF